ncbi:MAG: beta-ketoacyl synthase N-terminal-like domain-containing protein, partial [Geminicoccaceae bacterium]
MSGTPSDPKELLKRAFLEIRSLKARLAAAERDTKPPIAIIGIGCRFPGGVDDPASFWRLLLDGPDPIRPVPANRWPGADGSQPPGGFLDDVESFDAVCFEITPREAQAMDPQHRLLLETVWQALADAAIEPASLAGSRTGVFIGLATNDFARRTLLAGVDRFYGSGTSPAIAAGRIAYSLDLKGPCLTVDTACSSSLTAAHLAVRALRAGECDLALVGGVSLMLSAELGKSFAEAGMLAADGRCKSFDAAADGYGRAEGVGVIVLQRTGEAHAAGERVRAVIRGSAVNQDGRSAGLTAPNGPAQVAVIRAALADADLAPDAIDLIEAHGSGTPLGDVIEAQALATVFAGRTRPLLVGSVKSTIGHAEAAAGIAGLIKAALTIEHDLAAPSRHFRRLNPEIRPGGLDLVVPTAPVQGVHRVGVSSFGFSGSNAHLVLERPPEAAKTVKRPLPAPVFRRERFPLPGAAPDIRLLQPGDPLLAGTGGLAHLGVLLHLLGPVPRLEAMRFEQPLRITEPREIRLRTAAGEMLLESRCDGTAEWTVHLAARRASAGGPIPSPVMEWPRRTVPADALYRTIEAAGFGYGSEARRLVEVSVGAGVAMGTLAPGATLADPGVIEAAAQLLYGVIDDAEQRPPMLAGCAALERAGLDLPAARVWLRLRGREPSGTLMADLGVVAPDGRPIAWLESARFGRHRSFLDRFGHEVRWERAAMPAATAAPTIVLDGAGLPWPSVDSPAEACARLRSAPDPLLLIVGEGEEPTTAAARLLETIRALAGLPCRIVLATRGGVATGRGVEWPAQAGAAALWGLAQALIAEQPERRCRLVDLDPTRPIAAQHESVALECAAVDEPAVAWRQGRRYARHLRRIEPAPEAAPARAVLRAPGAPPSIEWEPLPPIPEAPAGQVLIEVVAAGLNFRDRLVALGLRPGDTPLGADLAGIVQQVGDGVEGLYAGDAVVALAEPALADLVLVPADLVRRAPVADLIAAATMPVAYATALAGLGRLEPGANVLVHQAAGATGLAAIEVARSAGAVVRATASAGKQPFLEAMGLERIADSRTPTTWSDLGPVEVAFGAFGPTLAAELPALRVVDLTGAGGAGFDLDALSTMDRGAYLARLDGFPPLPARTVRRDELAEAIASVGEACGRTVVLLR